MKLSELIEYSKKALEEYGDLDVNARYIPGDAWIRIDIGNYEEAFSYDEKENELLIEIG